MEQDQRHHAKKQPKPWNESRKVKTHLHEMEVCESENDAFPRAKTLKLLSHFGI